MVILVPKAIYQWEVLIYYCMSKERGNLLRIPMTYKSLLNNTRKTKSGLTHLLFTSEINGGYGPGLIGYYYLNLIWNNDISLQLKNLWQRISNLHKERIRREFIIYLSKIRSILRDDLYSISNLESEFDLSISDLLYRVYKLDPLKNTPLKKYLDNINSTVSNYYNYINRDAKKVTNYISSLLKNYAELVILNGWYYLVYLSYVSMYSINIKDITKILEDTEKNYEKEIWRIIFEVGNKLGYKNEWILSSIHYYPDAYSFSRVVSKRKESPRGVEWICLIHDCWLSKYSPIISSITGVEIKNIITMPALMYKKFWRYLYTTILGYEEDKVRVNIGVSNRYCRIRIIVLSP
jgi:hypothetical protein